MFRPGGLCQLLTEFCKQLTKTKTSEQRGPPRSACRRMSTWVVEHGMVPLLVPEVFPPVDFSMQAHVFFGDTWHHPYISTFCVENVFTSLASLLLMECKLHSGNLSLVATKRFPLKVML